MPERLTKTLVEQGILTPEQAAEAMERQVQQGGALDTSLLELGLVSEQDVVDAMGRAYGLAAASPDRASAPADPRVLRAFPEQWAKKHMLAPLTTDAATRAMTVLTPAPADLNLIARLGELLELEIDPLLAPEFRVAQRLDLLYDAEPPDRLAALIEKHGTISVAVDTPEKVVEPVVPSTDPLPFGEAVNALREARHRDEIAETTLRYAINDLQLVALFIVHSDHVEGWMGLGPGSEQVPKLPIPLKADSAFRVVLDTQAHYLGPLPSDPLHVEFLERLARPEPRAVLIVPIRIRSRTVALLYGENGSETIAPRLAADLMLFTTHVQGALESLLIRKKAESISELSARPVLPLGRMQKEAELTPVPPMEVVRGEASTEYAYVRKKDEDESESIDLAEPIELEEPIELTEPEDLPEHTLESLVAEDAQPADSTDAMAASFAPQAADDEEGWDSVDIAPTFDLPEPIPEDAFAGAVIAEHADGGALLDELRELDQPKAQLMEAEEGWDDVQVQPWDEFGGARDPTEAERWVERGHRELMAMRESLGEDITVPDLSAEAWIRAASDIVRPRALPPEVLERAALPSDEPMPLSPGVHSTIRAEDFPPDPAPIILGDPTEPVPLTQRSTASYGARSIDPNVLSTNSEIESHHDRAVDQNGNVVITGDLPRPDGGAGRSELDLLIDQVLSANREERKAALERLRALGVDVLPRVAEVFPGVLEVDPFATALPLPRFAECGVLPWLVAHFGAESHLHMVRRLDAPEPIRRFFAVYFYSSVFVPESIPKLIQRLHDEETRVSLLAARTLFSYREHPEFGRVLDHLHGRLEASSVTARRHATYLIGLFRDVTAIPNLIEVFDRKEKSMYEVAEDALAEITKQRFGPSAKKWRAWWTKNRDKSRIVWLIDGLTAKDAVLRKSAAEELRAVTGLDMGYDDDAPKRQREESRQRWLDWWNSNQESRELRAKS